MTNLAKNIVANAKAEHDSLPIVTRMTNEGLNWTKQDKARIIANNLVNPFSPYKVVSLKDEPVSLQTYLSMDTSVRATRGIYTIKYRPQLKKRSGCFAYLISQDLFSGAFTVASYKHLCWLGERIPEVAWLVRNTMITQDLFDIASSHPGVGFQFTIDYPRYCSMIENKAKQMGLDIDGKSLVAFQCNYQDFVNKFQKYEYGLKPTAHDYKDILEKEPEDLDNGKND